MKMENKGTKIILFIDNCSAHKDIPTLTNMKVIFMHVNTTSKLQLLDQGIIHTFKCYYHRDVVKHILTCLDKNIHPEVSMLFSMKFTKKAWYRVSNITVINGFKKARFWAGM